MRRTVLIVMLGLIGGAAGEMVAKAAVIPDSATFEAVVERLSAIDTLRGRFSQTRTIAALSRPLESSGGFIISELGLYWEQVEPFRTVLIADGERLSQRVANQPMITVTAAEQPVALSISQVLLGIFRGNGGVLGQYFAIAFEADGERWKMTLTPRGLPLSEAIDAIVIEGREYMERLSVRGRAEDELKVNFVDLQPLPVELSQDERALYTP